MKIVTLELWELKVYSMMMMNTLLQCIIHLLSIQSCVYNEFVVTPPPPVWRGE